MDALLQNLQEQQIQLQQRQFYIDDLANMENINIGVPPLPPPRKYVSIFHINGEPILPPLMTSEKRRQMQKLKEKAIKIEQSLKERKQRVYCENDLINEDIKSETSRTSLHNTGGNNSQRSQDYYESKLKETEESIILLQNIITRQQGGVEEKSTETVNTDCNTSLHSDRDENYEKLQKLRKSEILIYDNSTNEVIQLPAGKDRQLFEDHQRQFVEMECKANLNNVPVKKPSHLLLAGVNSEGLTAIPSICLNPPTPLTVNRNMCETLSAAECGVSLVRTDKQNNSFDFVKDLSSDDSMITQSDKRPVRRLSKHNVKSERCGSSERNPLTPVKNVSAKIQQFEAFSSDTNTPQTSPEKLFKTRKSCLGTATGSMSRSATSPSIKLPNSNRSSSSRSESLAQDSDSSPKNTLIRTSSFTLEGPSKALIDHLQQQKAISNSKTNAKSPLNTTRTVARKPISSPLRAHRDTVESKAKKVQKVELKSSKLNTQQKVSQSKLAQAAVALISPYTNNTLTKYTNNLSKTKRSPYDISKTAHTSLQTLQKTSSTPMRKSNSTSSTLVQSKTSKSRVSSSTTIQTPTSTTLNSAGTAKTGKESFTQMDQTKKEKFMHLLAQQQDEQRKLQQSFEMQQIMLIEQLNREMSATGNVSQLKSPTNSYNSPTTSSTLNYKRQDHKPLTGFSSETCPKWPTTPSYDFKQHKSHTKQQQPSSPTISNNSSYIYMTNNHSITANSQQSLYGSHHTPTSQPIPFNNSLLSSIDHSNANTSLDISTLSIQSSPVTLCATPTTQNNAVNNPAGNNMTTSSSRRRLFTTEMNDAGGESNNHSSRSTGSSTYSSGNPLGNLRQQPQLFNQSNRSPKSVFVNNNSNKRSPIDNSLHLHAAATKINACARGFLIRRLFQTEQIQRIVQTIRDTLIFVLNLHIDTMENPEESETPANIKLKARLLKQLSSASRTLHLVFFQTSIKERMEIIARDRKRIKTKLLPMNRRCL